MKISNVEWSGILLYSVKGSIKKPNRMRIILKDIIPMHKGNSTYTEYNFNEPKRDTSGYEDRMIDYFNDYPIAMEENWKIGHIHSHNTMDVFFSGTDTDELYENSACHDFYLSLIVNNWMDFTAKIAHRAEFNDIIEVSFSANDEKGNKFNRTKGKVEVKDEIIFVYDCDIEAPVDNIKVDDYFIKNVDEIIKKADKPVVNSYTSPSFSSYTTKNFQSVSKPDEKKDIKFFLDKIKEKENEELEITDIEIFTMMILNGGIVPEGMDLELLLTELQAFEDSFTPTSLGKSVLDIYAQSFDKFFENQFNEEFFIDISEQVVNLLEDYESEFKFLSVLIMLLKRMINKFEENK